MKNDYEVQFSASDHQLIKKSLKDFGRNIYSQFGEDGILEKILEKVEVKSKVAVEFGAWDGYHYSNTANLWTNGWKGILIEGITSRYETLKQNTKDYDCICINAYVKPSGDNSLESIIEDSGVGFDIGVLSIDIDGNDYWIFHGLQNIRPCIVICEYNPTIPAEIDLYAEYGNYFGASASALKRVATEKGYQLVAVTDTNCFFVLNELCRDLMVEYETRLECIKIETHLTYLITSYSGDYYLSKKPTYNLSLPGTETLIGQYDTFPSTRLCNISLKIKRLVSKLIKFMHR